LHPQGLVGPVLVELLDEAIEAGLLLQHVRGGGFVASVFRASNASARAGRSVGMARRDPFD